MFKADPSKPYPTYVCGVGCTILKAWLAYKAIYYVGARIALLVMISDSRLINYLASMPIRSPGGPFRSGTGDNPAGAMDSCTDARMIIRFFLSSGAYTGAQHWAWPLYQ